MTTKTTSSWLILTAALVSLVLLGCTPHDDVEQPRAEIESAADLPETQPCNCNTGQECYMDACIDTPSSIIERHYQLASAVNLTEHVENLEKSRQYQADSLRAQTDIEITAYKAMEKEILPLLAEIRIICPSIKLTRRCEQDIDSLTTTFLANPFAAKYTTLSIAIDNESNDAVIATVQRRAVTSDESNTATRQFKLKKLDGGWKIVDIGGTDLNWTSQTDLQEFKETLDENYKAIANSTESMRQYWLRLKRDECSYLFKDDSIEDDDLESRQDDCYESRYLDVAYKQKDTAHCESISDDNYYGQCLGRIAAATDNPDICFDGEARFYEARAGLTSSSDTCAISFMQVGAYKLTLQDRYIYCERLYAPFTEEACKAAARSYS
jgi:hypothetical protein